MSVSRRSFKITKRKPEAYIKAFRTLDNAVPIIVNKSWTAWLRRLLKLLQPGESHVQKKLNYDPTSMQTIVPSEKPG
jgi:hypothetical protein